MSDPSVSGLYLPRVCVISCCCHSWHEWTHLWVGCICLVCAFYLLVVTVGMSGPICEWAVSASRVCYMLLLSLSAWVEPSVSGLYLAHVCVICPSCHSRHEWTHLWVGCICLVCALYVLVVTLGMSGAICELAVSASSVRYLLLLSLLAWVDPSVSGLYLLRVCVICCCCHSWHEWPICELAVSASCVRYLLLLSLLAWVDPYVSWLYLPRVCVLSSSCHCRHEWTHLWVGCICLVCALSLVVFLLLAWVDPSVSWLYLPRVCVLSSCCNCRHDWTHLWVGCICLECVLYLLVVTLGMSDPSVSGLYLLRVCVICCCCHSRHEWSHLWVGCICFECALYVVVVTLGMSGPICEWAVSASSVCYIFLLSLLAWVDPSVSGLYLLWVCVISCCCHSWHEWSHLWVGCICFECVLCVVVVSFGMSGAICEWAISASSVCYMLLLSLSAWVEPSVSGLYLLRVCVICCCCHSRHEWTHLWVGCICLVCVLHVLIVTFGMSGPICELAVSASSVCYILLLSLLAWVDPSVSGLYLPRVCIICCCCHSWHEWPICEWAVSASCVRYLLLLSLLAWVDPSVSWLYLPRVCVLSSCCNCRHEWTHLWVGCICLECVLYLLVVTLGMNGSICEWAVSASRVCYMLLLSLSAWVEPSVSGLYLAHVCVICPSCHSRHEWTHLWVGCICLVCALYVLVVTLGMRGPICEWAVSASSVCYMFLLSLLAQLDPSVSGLYLHFICFICSCCHS